MTRKNRFKVVLLDLGGTLIKTAEISEIYRRILSRYGIKVECEKIDEAHAMNEKEFNMDEMCSLGAAFWFKWNSRILERVGVQGDREFLAKKISELWWEHADLQVYPEVVDTLVRLKAKGVRLGIVSNALDEDFQQIMKRLPLSEYFDVVVGFDACKKVKPDVEIFQYALSQLHVRPEDALFVGDSMEKDFKGSRKAGLKPLLINRTGQVKADVATIKSLTDVLSYL
jgi:putative hydrolase of the HAD superfamily